MFVNLQPRERLRTGLIIIILATIPIYCGGLAAVRIIKRPRSTPTPTNPVSLTATSIPAKVATPYPTFTPSLTQEGVTETPIPTATRPETETAEPSETSTETPTATHTETAQPSDTPVDTNTPVPSGTLTPSLTNESSVPPDTDTPTPSITPSNTPEAPTVTNTGLPTEKPPDE